MTNPTQIPPEALENIEALETWLMQSGIELTELEMDMLKRNLECIDLLPESDRITDRQRRQLTTQRKKIAQMITYFEASDVEDQT